MMKISSLIVIILFNAFLYAQEISVIKTGESGFGLNWELREYEDAERSAVYIVLPFFDTSNDSLNIKQIQILTQDDLIKFCELLTKKGNEINYTGSTENFNGYAFTTICSVPEHNHKGSDYIWLKSNQGATSLISKVLAIQLAEDLLKCKSLITLTNETLY